MYITYLHTRYYQVAGIAVVIFITLLLRTLRYGSKCKLEIFYYYVYILYYIYIHYTYTCKIFYGGKSWLQNQMDRDVFVWTGNISRNRSEFKWEKFTLIWYYIVRHCGHTYNLIELHVLIFFSKSTLFVHLYIRHFLDRQRLTKYE